MLEKLAPWRKILSKFELFVFIRESIEHQAANTLLGLLTNGQNTTDLNNELQVVAVMPPKKDNNAKWDDANFHIMDEDLDATELGCFQYLESRLHPPNLRAP